MEEKRIGNQEPTIHFALPYEATDGQGAIDLYELTGRTALEWQKRLVNDILARNDKTLWTHTRYGYSVPRQNGKGEILAIIELYALAAGLRVLHTAHLTSTSHKAWERVCMLLDCLGVHYKSIKAKGQELIDIHSGGRIEYRTRTAKGGLGESYDILIVDEAQEYQDDQESALKYVISASPNPMTIMCGTPPTPVSSGTVFKNYRLDVLTGKAEDAGWAEWSVNEFSDVNDRERWYQTNPSLGIRLTERTLSAETGNDEDKKIDFNIQRLGLWIKHNQQSAITKADWDKILVNEMPKLKGKLNVGIKYSKDGETVSMAIAVTTADDHIFFEVINNKFVREGNDWIIDFCSRAKDGINKIIIDGANGQQLLMDELTEKKIKSKSNIILPTVSQVIKANAAFERYLLDQKLQRMEQPSLTNVATNTERRTIGSHGGFGFSAQRTGEDITLLDAAIYAIWAASEYKETTKQKAGY